MLLVLSAPPSNVDILDFTDNGVKGFLFDIRRPYNRKFRFTTSQVQTDRKTCQSSPFRSQEVPVMTGAKTLGSAKRLAGLDLGLSKNRGGAELAILMGKWKIIITCWNWGTLFADRQTNPFSTICALLLCWKERNQGWGKVVSKAWLQGS